MIIRHSFMLISYMMKWNDANVSKTCRTWSFEYCMHLALFLEYIV